MEQLLCHFDQKTSRVDVSETFSADQLWFRILSGLFQRCSLPENLWTALIQLWTALKTEIFRAKNQPWNSAVSALIFSETALFSSETALIFSVLNSADSEKIRADQLWNRGDQRWCLSCSLKQRWKTSKLWNSAVQRWLYLGLQPGFVQQFFWPTQENSKFWSFFHQCFTLQNVSLDVQIYSLIVSNFVQLFVIAIFTDTLQLLTLTQ